MTDLPLHKRAVYDTGVVLQAALSDRGPAFTALRQMEEGKVVVVLSPQVRHEYEDVLTRPAIQLKNPFLTPDRVRLLLERIEAKAELVTVIRTYLQYPRDPKYEPALMDAAWWDNISVVKILLQKGADTHPYNKKKDCVADGRSKSEYDTTSTAKICCCRASTSS